MCTTSSNQQDYIEDIEEMERRRGGTGEHELSDEEQQELKQLYVDI